MLIRSRGFTLIELLVTLVLLALVLSSAAPVM
ncbi:MAG: prepilin-type N-terminal cleavage/methylation domain-containing protein, partial [Nitrosomonadales bacterium]|nr:prepilin-type N-terminal cleavage/methylation domain-containing protein [Nitrosomonadales bacterium]